MQALCRRPAVVRAKSPAMEDNPYAPPESSPQAQPRGQFQTRFGTCRVDASGIHLVNDSARGTFSAVLTGRSIWTLRAVYAIINLYAMGAFLTAMASGAPFEPLYPFLIAYTAFALWRTMNHTRDMDIAREEIRNVVGFPGRKYLTVPRFLVLYERDGVALKRMIQLHGALFAEPKGFEDAKAVFAQVGLEVQ